MDSGHDGTITDGPRRSTFSRLRPWLGVLGYVVGVALVSLLGISWGPLGGLEAQALLLLSCCVGLVAAGFLPRLLAPRALQFFVLSLGWLIVVGAGVMGWLEPHAFIRERDESGLSSYRTTLHPFFTGALLGLLFLVALGHTVRFGSSLRRLLCLDVPLLVFLVLCWVLHLRGYPVFEG
ncbi:hypothetical protein F0U62_13125 [Cystobacter fuscus]|uniref:hypothetical protein n=1 Tax=Cystobacter fuscus TaxID=43 RepID=UPI002B2A0F43|nr:hypothetical protein F0U62_13125 [Cystobacter fuscus]